VLYGMCAARPIAKATEVPCEGYGRFVKEPADEGGVSAGRKRDGRALAAGSPNSAGADQLSLLGPDTIAANEDPRRPDSGFAPEATVGRVVEGPAHDGGLAVSGKRDGPALPGRPNSAGADQLRLLHELRPRERRRNEHRSERQGGSPKHARQLKLTTILNAILRDRRPWQPIPA